MPLSYLLGAIRSFLGFLLGLRSELPMILMRLIDILNWLRKRRLNDLAIDNATCVKNCELILAYIERARVMTSETGEQKSPCKSAVTVRCYKSRKVEN